MRFINITEIRTKISSIARKSRKGEEIVVLKNGKPTLALVDYGDYEEYKEWKLKRKKEATVEAFHKLQKMAEDLKLGERYVREKGLDYNALSEDELLQLLYDDEKDNS